MTDRRRPHRVGLCEVRQSLMINGNYLAVFKLRFRSHDSAGIFLKIQISDYLVSDSSSWAKVWRDGVMQNV
jgi:hypothetical protein